MVMVDLRMSVLAIMVVVLLINEARASAEEQPEATSSPTPEPSIANLWKLVSSQLNSTHPDKTISAGDPANIVKEILELGQLFEQIGKVVAPVFGQSASSNSTQPEAKTVANPSSWISQVIDFLFNFNEDAFANTAAGKASNETDDTKDIEDHRPQRDHHASNEDEPEFMKMFAKFLQGLLNLFNFNGTIAKEQEAVQVLPTPPS